ncbi:hypothetical protein AB835_01585 [Candidatus Endobugula sertula]|uniref:Type IV secretion system coupling protein TraD DNA-binding domain-containing protein n=1 Tax=Candidatus Endobugula sertula TaxID=62101 RepID=A0A1D2QT91_9GAMM|nr:hypothetical protein AB835_01585 [Candidatus Endobugula sertula]
MQNLAELHAMIDSLSIEQVAFIIVFYGNHIAAALFALRGITVFLGRHIGFYHPDHYHLWPRLPWRIVLRLWFALKQWKERTFTFGKRASGGFASVLATLCMMYKPGNILLGRAYAFGMPLMQPIGINVKRHLFMFAMTGGGKTSALVSIISCWRGSVFLIDPKATITNSLHARDKRRWYVLDLSNISTTDSICINIFDCLKEAIERDGIDAAVLWAYRIAQSLITTPEGARSPYFYDISRGFIAGLILHVLTTHKEDDHNLPFLRDLIIQGYRVFNEDGKEETTALEAQALLLRSMRNNMAFDGVIAGAATAVMNAGGETGGNVRSTLQEQTKWLDIPLVRSRLKHSDLSLSILKTENDCVLSITATVFSVREELSDFIRLLTNMVSYTFEAVTEKKGQCLTVVDEFPSLGYNEAFEVLLPVARSHGQTFLGISQDTELLEKYYPKSWEGFIGNADCVYWMASNHKRTRTYLSDTLGKVSQVEKDKQYGRKTYREVEVMDADQVGRFLKPESQRIIITRAGKRALKLINDPFFKALPVWRYAADPEYGDSWLRRLGRWLFDRTPLTTSKPVSSPTEENDNDTSQ